MIFLCETVLNTAASFVYFQLLLGEPISEKGNKVSKGAKIRNRYNQVPHLTQDTNGSTKDPQKKYHLGTVSKIFYWRA